MTAYNAAIRAIAMPSRIAALPVSPKGYPVPWFVAETDGVYDFRVIGPGKLEKAVRWRKCWICGQMMGRFQAVVVGPMCVINRTSAEPGCHRECAIYSAIACPFTNNPAMRRRVGNMSDATVNPAGTMLKRNPGVTCVWVTDAPISPFKVGTGILFKFSDPTEIHWYAEGRLATRQEVVDSIASGMPALTELAEREGIVAMKALHQKLSYATRYLPAPPLQPVEAVEVTA